MRKHTKKCKVYDRVNKDALRLVLRIYCIDGKLLSGFKSVC